jgi:hypothetical protein
MSNTTKAELIKGIREMDAALGTPVHKGLTRMHKVEVFQLHSEVLDAFLVATQPEIDALHAKAEAEIVRNVQVDIVDLDTDDAINLAADVARQAMIDAGMPVGPTTPVQLALFEGSYLVDLPAEWYSEHVNDATDFWAETGNVAVTISLP